jgi:hypothetical protein
MRPEILGNIPSLLCPSGLISHKSLVRNWCYNKCSLRPGLVDQGYLKSSRSLGAYKNIQFQHFFIYESEIEYTHYLGQRSLIIIFERSRSISVCTLLRKKSFFNSVNRYLIIYCHANIMSVWLKPSPFSFTTTRYWVWGLILIRLVSCKCLSENDHSRSFFKGQLKYEPFIRKEILFSIDCE